MMQTRGPKPRFEVGERVLCYDPDPTKIKMLYDAKVLDVMPSNEVLPPEVKNRPRGFAYNVHFQGWNSHWDRYVADDMLLKDSQENRDYQRHLYEQTEEYRVRVERKKKQRKSTDKARLSFDSNPSPVPSENTSEYNYQLRRGQEERFSIQEDEDVQLRFNSRLLSRAESDKSIVEEEKEDTEPENNLEESRNEDGDENEKKELGEKDANEEEDLCTELVPLNLPQNLKDSLEADYNNVSDGKLVRLPAQPNIITLLEGYVRNFAISKLAALEKRLQKYNQNQYRQPDKDETELAEEVVQHINICKEVAEGVRILIDFHLGNILLYPQEKDQFTRSPNIRPHMESLERLVSEPQTIPLQTQKPAGKKQKNRSDEAEDPSSAKRRHHPRKKESESEGQQAVAGSVGSSAASSSGGTDSTPTHSTVNQTAAVYPQTKQSLQILQDLYSWKLVPESVYFEEPVPASLVYGGVHLARLLVKLPELFLRMRFSNEKLKHLMKFLEFMVDYIANQEDVFSDSIYQ